MLVVWAAVRSQADGCARVRACACVCTAVAEDGEETAKKASSFEAKERGVAAKVRAAARGTPLACCCCAVLYYAVQLFWEFSRAFCMRFGSAVLCGAVRCPCIPNTHCGHHYLDIGYA